MPTATMRAVVCHGPRDYRVEERPRPRPGADELLVKVGAAGICASDMKCFNGGPLFWGDQGVGGYCEAPVIAGHEFAGRVVELGDGAAERHGVAFSVLNEPAQINWTLVGDQKELNIHGSHLGPYCYPAAIDSIATGKIDVLSLITADYPLDQFDDAMRTAMGGANLKTLLIP